MASPRVLQLVQLLRDSTENQLIYAEQCDVLQPSSVTTFAETWNKGLTQSRKTNPLAGAAGSGGSEGGLRLDAIVLLPLAETTYSMGEGKQRVHSAGKGEQGGATWANYELSHAEVAGRYHLVQSMLSSLLLLPPDRDIRIISACSPWYSAGLPTFSKDPDYDTRPFPTWQPWCAAGSAAIHWLALTHELQRRLNSLAEADPRPRGPLAAVDPSNADISSVSRDAERVRRSQSNIRVVNVCLGFERNADLLPYLLPPVQPEQAPIVDRATPANGKQDEDEEHEELLEQLRARVDPRTRSSKSNGGSASEPHQVNYAPATYTRGKVSTFSATVRYLLATILWPLIWLCAKSPASAASGVTWALVASDPIPVVLHREGEPRQLEMPVGAREPQEQRALWEAEEKRAKDALRKRA